jgi:hypothetical protein
LAATSVRTLPEMRTAPGSANASRRYVDVITMEISAYQYEVTEPPVAGRTTWNFRSPSTNMGAESAALKLRSAGQS